MKSYQAKSGEVPRSWLLIDAKNQILGRLASEVAVILRGKNKPVYTPHTDTGDFVVITNAQKIKVTGNKLEDKVYYHHTGYMGGLKETNLQTLLAKNPEKVIRLAVKNMLPRSDLSRIQLKKLKIYKGAEHPHQAQNPKDHTF
jgi:large subunit ribosomal protein L13